MNLRNARRLSSFKYNRRGEGVDVFEYLKENHFVISWSNSKKFYRCSFYLDGKKYLRAKRCAYKLGLLVYQMAATRHADFEGTHVNVQQQKASGILTAVRTQLHSDFPIRSAPNYGKPHTLSKKKSNRVRQAIVEEAIYKEYGQEMVDKVTNNWVHSSEVTDPNLIAPGFNKLAQRPLQPLNREVAAKLLLMQMIRQKQQYTDKKHLVDLTPKNLATATQNRGSAAGILPIQNVNGIMGRLSGKKGDMHAAAVAVNITTRIRTEIPRTIPYKVFLKGEVIKKGKAVRGIQNESLANYEILSLSEPERAEVRLGNAIGMGGLDKSFASIFVVWYKAYFDVTGLYWMDFIRYLEDAGAHESDKVGWEASTNITDCLPRIIMLANEKRFKTPECKKLYIAALTDSHFPFIYLHKEQFQCPARVPSGTYFTSKGNTARHRSMNDFVCHYVRSHGLKLGNPNCSCSSCVHMSAHEAFGEDITKLELALREKAFILGDDYIATSWGPKADAFFDELMDTTFGTETKTEQKGFFEDAEFLRKKFKVDDEGSITWYRDPERVLAKIYHGEFLDNPVRMAEALTSYKYEAGDNQKLVDCISRIYANIEEEVDQELDMTRYSIKRPLLKDVKNFWQFTCDDVVNIQKQFARTVENVLTEHL